MKRTTIQLHGFTRKLDELIATNKLLAKDFEEFEWNLIGNPQKGDVISGLGGLEKSV